MLKNMSITRTIKFSKTKVCDTSNYNVYYTIDDSYIINTIIKYCNDNDIIFKSFKSTDNNCVLKVKCNYISAYNLFIFLIQNRCEELTNFQF